MKELLELADRCERAPTADGDIDAAIFHHFKPSWRQYDRKPGYMTNGFLVLPVPIYTASLDEAMSILPSTWKLRQMNFSAPCADDRKWHLNLHGGRDGEYHMVGRGASAELAFCAAALRVLAI